MVCYIKQKAENMMTLEVQSDLGFCCSHMPSYTVSLVRQCFMLFCNLSISVELQMRGGDGDRSDVSYNLGIFLFCSMTRRCASVWWF